MHQAPIWGDSLEHLKKSLQQQVEASSLEELEQQQIVGPGSWDGQQELKELTWQMTQGLDEQELRVVPLPTALNGLYMGVILTTY